MAGNYHFTGDFNSKYANVPDSHFSGDFTDPTGAVTGCTGKNFPSQSMNVRELQTGGQGYGMAEQQPIAGFNRIPDHISYEEIGANDPENLGASTQYNPSMALPVIRGGKRHKRGGANLNYYGFNDKNNENLSVFAGAGYPPITVGSQNLTGGKRMRHRKLKTKSHKRSRHHKSHKLSKHRRPRHHHKTKKHRLGMKKGMTSKLFKKLIGGKKRVYKGGYSQFLGDQAFSQGYELGGPISPSTSALANPIPIKPYNNCSDPFGPK
jgi:hypothetical protein